MKNKSYILFIVLVILFACDRKNSDSPKPKQKVIDSLLTIAENHSNTNLQRSQSLLQAYTTIKVGGADSRESLLRILKGYTEIGEYKSLNAPNKLLLSQAIHAKDSVKQAYSIYFSAYIAEADGKLDSAFYYYSKAEKLFLKLNHKDVLGNLFLKKSSIQLNYLDVLGAEYSATQSLKYARANNDFLGQYDALTNLGIASHSSEDYPKSIEYNNMALDLATKNNLNPEYFLQEISLNNIGNDYLYLKQYKNAIFEFDKALKNQNLLGKKPGLYATLLDNVTYSRFKLDPKLELAEPFKKALKIREKLKLTSRVIYSKIHLSEYYAAKSDTLNAQKFAKEALTDSKQTGMSTDLLASLKQIAVVDHENSSNYSKDYIKISDSLQLAERKSKDKFARIAFETDEIILEKDKLAEQNRSLFYFFIGSLFVGILLFVIRTQRAKNRELLLKQQQQKANEDIYNLMISQQAIIEESRVKEKKRIAQELHDGVLGRLFGARLNLDSLNRFADDDSVTSRFNYLDELKNIEQDIREISHDLNREKYVLINNFVAIVNNLIEEQRSSFPPELKFTIDESIKWDAISNAIKINLYRILQESLQNINKYAAAKKITVEFKSFDDSIVLKVNDDGAGFDTDVKKKGIGLQNMVSRANECNGVLDIRSKKGKGTTITITIPTTQKVDA